jgi:hypothetical protein
VNEIRNPGYTKKINTFWIPARARFAGLGRDDELRHSLKAGGLNRDSERIPRSLLRG